MPPDEEKRAALNSQPAPFSDLRPEVPTAARASPLLQPLLSLPLRHFIVRVPCNARHAPYKIS